MSLSSLSLVNLYVNEIGANSQYPKSLFTSHCRSLPHFISGVDWRKWCSTLVCDTPYSSQTSNRRNENDRLMSERNLETFLVSRALILDVQHWGLVFFTGNLYKLSRISLIRKYHTLYLSKTGFHYGVLPFPLRKFSTLATLL